MQKQELSTDMLWMRRDCHSVWRCPRLYSVTGFLTVTLCLLISTKFYLAMFYDCRCPTQEQFVHVKEQVITNNVHNDSSPGGYPRLLLACVNSNVNAPERRHRIRNSWGKEHFQRQGLGVVFFVGVSKDPSINHAIKLENATYGDIVQVDVVEDYYNLTSKMLHIMAYASKHLLQQSQQAEHGAGELPVEGKYIFYLKVDDDFLVNIFALLERVYNMVHTNDTTNIIYCHIWYHNSVMRTGKYAVSPLIYSQKSYPRFCSGGAYIISHDVVAKLLNVAPYLTVFPLEDVHITGFLRALVDVPLRAGNGAYHLFHHFAFIILSASWNSYMFSHINDPEVYNYIWSSLESQAGKCQHPFVSASK